MYLFCRCRAPPVASCQIYEFKCGKFETDTNHFVRGLVKRARANLQCYNIDLSVRSVLQKQMFW